MNSPELGSEEIIATFQRRRRLAFAIRNGTAWLGIGGGGAILIWLSSLHHLKDPPYGLFAAFVTAFAIFIIGAFVHPYLYRCPRCNRRVEVPDPTEAGGILLEDPENCPNCGARLKGFAGHHRGRRHSG